MSSSLLCLSASAFCSLFNWSGVFSYSAYWMASLLSQIKCDSEWLGTNVAAGFGRVILRATLVPIHSMNWLWHTRPSFENLLVIFSWRKTHIASHHFDSCSSKEQSEKGETVFREGRSCIFAARTWSVPAVGLDTSQKERKKKTKEQAGRWHGCRKAWLDGRRKAMIITKADSAAMTSLFWSPRGRKLSHTKSEAVKVTKTNANADGCRFTCSVAYLKLQRCFAVWCFCC